MKHDELYRLIDLLVSGEIGKADHARLSRLLEADADSRTAFRERIDLEVSLRTWASESISSSDVTAGEIGAHQVRKAQPRKPNATRWIFAFLATTAATAIFVVLQVSQPISNHAPIAKDQGKETFAEPKTNKSTLLGFLEQQDGCEWRVRPVRQTGRFAAGTLALDAGVAALRFDSGTSVTLHGPCKIEVTSVDSALLHSGDICVNVSELSNGFTLLTPESRIVDEGTEFGVSITSEATEIHVFEGSVIYTANTREENNPGRRFEDRISTGEARRFSRTDPKRARHIPFGAREFVRALDATAKESGGEALLAYDGFENLAGRVRRGRSGFGWSGGWQTGGPGRGKLGEIVDCPDDSAFDFERAGRRMMQLEQAMDIRRDFIQPLELAPGNDLYVGVLVSPLAEKFDLQGQTLQLSLEPNIPGRGRRLHQIVAFGVATDGFPFIRSANRIVKTATHLQLGRPSFFAFKLQVDADKTDPFMRVYQPGESIDTTEPSTWTVVGSPGSTSYSPTSLRIENSPKGVWQIDELKLGTSWQSIHPVAARTQ